MARFEGLESLGESGRTREAGMNQTHRSAIREESTDYQGGRDRLLPEAAGPGQEPTQGSGDCVRARD